MKKKGAAITAVLLIAAWAQAQPIAVGPATDCAAVRGVMETYALAANKGDPDLRLSLWDDGGMQFRNDMVVLDRAAIAQRVRANMGGNNMQMTLTVEEVVVSGDLAFARGPYTSRATPKAGGTGSFTDGRFMTILRRQPDGSWKIYRDMMVVR
jgi:ketosteroid isomerase-like protein